MKLDVHGEMAYECSATHDEAMLAKKINPHDETVYEHLAMHVAKLRSNEFSYNTLSAKLASRRSYMKNPEAKLEAEIKPASNDSH